LTLSTDTTIFIEKNINMEKIIQNVEKWKSYIPKEDNPKEREMVSHRITTTDGHQYVCWRWEDDEELKNYSNYQFKETGTKQFSFFNEPMRDYVSVRVIQEIPVQTNKQVINDTPTLFDQESPVETIKMVHTDNMVEYHKLAVEVLWKMNELNLPNLHKLAPLMKDICEGKINENKLGKLHLEMYGKMN
jgi:hypothetical protein